MERSAETWRDRQRRGEVGRDVERSAETWRGRQRRGEVGRDVERSADTWRDRQRHGEIGRDVASSGEPWHCQRVVTVVRSVRYDHLSACTSSGHPGLLVGGEPCRRRESRAKVGSVLRGSAASLEDRQGP